MGETGLRVALRSSDPLLVGHVRRVTDVAGWALDVTPAGGTAPRADVHVDSVRERGPGDPPWARGVRSRREGPLWVAREQPGEWPAPEPASAVVHLLPEADAELAEAIADRAELGHARVVGVVGARGGVGASVFVGALAREAAGAGATCALVDLDPAGGLDVLLAIEHEPGPRWADLDATAGSIPPDALAAALPVWHAVHVLAGDARGGPSAGALVPALRALREAHDVVLLDLSRRADDAGATALAACDDVVVLAPGDVHGAAGLLSLAPRVAGRGHLVVRQGTAGDAVLAAPDELAVASGLGLAGVVRHERALRAGLERGMAPGDRRRSPLVRTARAVARRLVPA
ncbi:conserved hypothetical protein [Beutenbergia cavernae DSM 12333]|uniref:Uncharacterized protein n=1 Tax=Beutenbergia cavernae (strain ATCC BAA-8 / DSM 12333 / CCUG 43141 / JCM 11478 / NBRC 16432 / NCIMB 13614 / HKI 0122) TaxID=471853 RepID=C5BXY6_BEUC1|nr:cellulose synthase operon protein YhjQ/BcsQ [Beutenbergia cavernae]ACQ78880.1 conserved hypothetical protein [Beutenbergia cavernae DSM 12333]